MPLLWIALACGGSPPSSPLPQGMTEAMAAEEPAWGVLVEGETVVRLAAVPQGSDVILSVAPPSGAPIRDTSAHLEHRAAVVRAQGAGTHRVQVTPAATGERAPFTLLQLEPMSGDPCTQLSALGEDSWDLPGVDHPSDDPARRTRTLLAAPPWADRCTVNRLGDLDVGPSCTRDGLEKAAAQALFTEVSAAFQGCHAGWTLAEESAPDRREWVAEKGTALRFLRMREIPDRGWQVSIGAMPEE